MNPLYNHIHRQCSLSVETSTGVVLATDKIPRQSLGVPYYYQYYSCLTMELHVNVAVKTCPDGIPNGSFDVNCSRHLDETCQYSCDTGYKKMIDEPLKCLENQTWEVNVTDVCICG